MDKNRTYLMQMIAQTDQYWADCVDIFDGIACGLQEDEIEQWANAVFRSADGDRKSQDTLIRRKAVEAVHIQAGAGCMVRMRDTAGTARR